MAALKGSVDGCLIVGVTIKPLGQRKLALDPIEAARQGSGEDQVEVGVCARHAVLDADGTLTVVDDAHRAGTVVHAPGRIQRRPGALDVALVRVDDGSVEYHELR